MATEDEASIPNLDDVGKAAENGGTITLDEYKQKVMDGTS